MDLLSAVNNFFMEGKVVSIVPIGSGHINTTFLVTTDQKKYTLQNINNNVFKNIDLLIDNINAVTKHILGKRHYFELISAKNGKKYAEHEGKYYRMFDFFEGYCIDKVSCSQDMFFAGEAFGQFQADLQDFDGQLFETIPNFHNTPKRYENFQKSLLKASKSGSNRVFIAKTDIEKYIEREHYCSQITDKINNGSLPLRVTHNDTKINNIVFDENTQRPICVIDLDTVMQGSLLYDFGDAIRSGGVVTEEDERDTDIIALNEEFFTAFAKGFLSKAQYFITEAERDLLAFSAILMTYECGMRFLTDYLDNDIYFKISYSDQNLVRARSQMALVVDMEKKYDKMKEIIRRLWEN